MGAYDAQKRFDQAVLANKNGIADRLRRIGIDPGKVIAIERGWSNWDGEFDRATVKGRVLALLSHDGNEIEFYNIKKLA